MSDNKTNRPIHIRFQPYCFDKKQHVIEKADSTGVKRKYMRGGSSGIMRDGTGERMTLSCIKSMMEQGNSGDVLLYAGLHGVNFIDDLGVLTESSIENNTDWITTYRLYDEHDNMPAETIGKADKLWKQVTGSHPYKKPIQKGFSVEGLVPESEILEKKIQPDGSWTNRVINDMILDGVVVVSRPAYQDSIVSAVYKCLGELAPVAKSKIQQNIKNQLVQKIQDNNKMQNFYQKYFEVNGVFEDQLHNVMKVKDNRSEERLDILLTEYCSVMKDLVLQNAGIFGAVAKSDFEIPEQPGKSQQLIKSLASTMRLLSNSISKRIGEK